MAAPAVAMPGTWPATARGFSLPVQDLESCSESSCLLRVQLSPLPPCEAESKSATDKDSKKKPRRRKKKKEDAAAEPEESLSASGEPLVDVGIRRSTWGGGFARATAFFFSEGGVARRVLEASAIVLVPASCLALWWRKRRGGVIVSLLVFGGLLSSRVIRGRRASSRTVAAHGRGGAEGRSKKKKVSRNKATSLDTGSEASILEGEGAKTGRSVFKRGTKLEVDVADNLSLVGAAAAMGGVRRSSMGEWKHAGDGKDEGGGGGEEGEDEGEGPQLSLEELHAAIIRPRGCFGRDMSVARWREEEGVAEVVRLRGRSWTSMGIIRDGRNLLLPEECVFLVERGTLLLLMGEDDRIASVQEAYSLLEPSILSLSDPILACHLDAYIAYAYLKRLGYVVGRHAVPFTLPKCSPPTNKTPSTSADASATSAGIDARSAVTATPSALSTAESDGPDTATCSVEEREFPVDHEAAVGTVGTDGTRCQDMSGGETSGGESAGMRVQGPSTSAETSAMSADIDARSADPAAMSELATMAENDGIHTATCPVEERDSLVDHEMAAGTASTDSARCGDGIEGEMCRGESAGARGKVGAGALGEMLGEDLGTPRLERGCERGRESASCRSSQSVNEDSRLIFDVYRPNTRFRKSCPGDPLFSLVVSSERPPSRARVKEAQAASGSVPVKFAAVNSGSVTIFAFDSISLPVLP